MFGLACNRGTLPVAGEVGHATSMWSREQRTQPSTGRELLTEGKQGGGSLCFFLLVSIPTYLACCKFFQTIKKIIIDEYHVPSSVAEIGNCLPVIFK